MKWNKRNCNFEGSVHGIQLSKVRQVFVLLFRYFGILWLCPYKLKRRIWREIFMIYDVVMIVSLFWEGFMEFCRCLIKKKFIRIIDIFIPSFLEMEVKLILHQKTYLVTFNINNSLPFQIYNKRFIRNKYWSLHSFKFKSIEIIVKIDNKCIIIEFIAEWCNF